MKPLDQIIEGYDRDRDKLNADFVNNRLDSDDYKLLLRALRASFKARVVSVILRSKHEQRR